MALVSRVVALSAFVLVIAAPAAMAATWRQITDSDQHISHEVSVARTGNGALNVLWYREKSIVNSQVSANGKTVSGPHAVFTYAAAAASEPMLLADRAGGLRAFFTGLQGDFGPFDDRLNTATSLDGVSWSVQSTAAEADHDGRNPFGGTIWTNGTPMSIWGGFNGSASYHVGTAESTPDVRYHQHDPNVCCVASANAGTDSATGAVAIAYTDLGGDDGHVIHFVQPTTNPWFPPGPAIDIPGDEAPDNRTRIPMTGRSDGEPGIFVAYLRGTNAFTSRPAVWRIGAQGPMNPRGRKGARDPGIAMSSDGRLWAYWAEGTETGETRRIFAARTNEEASRFGQKVLVKPLRGAQAGNVWNLAGEGTAPGGTLDLVAEMQTSTDGDDVAHYVTRVLPGITLKVKKLDNGKIQFTTLDAGDKLAAKVKFDGDTRQTGNDGKITFPAPNPGRYKAKATTSGYTPITKKVKVKAIEDPDI